MDVVQMADELNRFERALAPYRTGNLRDNGIGATESFGPYSAGYRINEGDYAPYGLLLNEAPSIRNPISGRTYVNRHYLWHDTAFSWGVEVLAQKLGGVIV